MATNDETQHTKPCYVVAYSDFVWNGQIISINMSTIMYKCCILDLVGGITAAISRFTCIARFREDYLPVYKRTGIHPLQINLGIERMNTILHVLCPYHLTTMHALQT